MAYFEDVLEISTELIKTGNTSLTVQQQIYHCDSKKVVVEALVTFVLLNTQTNDLVQVDENLKKMFQ